MGRGGRFIVSLSLPALSQQRLLNEKQRAAYLAETRAHERVLGYVHHEIRNVRLLGYPSPLLTLCNAIPL